MQDLQALRAKAEDSFNAIQTSLNSIKAELQKYGLETIEEGYAELNRLQGEFRVINDLISKQPEEAEKSVSKSANKIDTTKVKGA